MRAGGANGEHETPRPMRWSRQVLSEAVRGEIGYAGGTVTVADGWAVLRRLRGGGSILTGPHIERYHAALASYFGTRLALSYGAARMALFCLLEAMELREDDEIILPGYNCIVIPNAIRFAGLRPVYVDIRDSDFNIDPDRIERAITPRTRAVMVQHSFGIAADMDAVGDICRRHGLPLLEDCAHAIGATLDGRKLGTIGYAGFFSTEATKMFSTEKGGILVTSDESLASRLRERYERLPFRPEPYERRMAQRFALRCWMGRPSLNVPIALAKLGDVALRLRRIAAIEGYDADDYAGELAGRRSDPYPCRLSDVMALAGLRQLERIDADLAHRRRLADELERLLPGKGARLPRYDRRRCQPSWVRYPFLVDDLSGWVERLTTLGLKPGYWLNHPCHPRGSNDEFAMYRAGMCPVAERVSRRILNVPVHSRVPLSRIRRLARLPDASPASVSAAAGVEGGVA